MKLNTKYEISILVVIVLISFFVRSLPYLLHNYNYLLGFDTGMYQYLFIKYVNSDIWPIYSTYPPLEPYELSLSIWMEPGFFILNSIINKIITLSTPTFFMYYLPFQISLIFLFLLYTIVRNLTNNPTAGFIACLFWLTSTLQVGLINASFYKQIFGIFILLITIYSLQKLNGTDNIAYLICATIFGSAMIFYHRTEMLPLAVIYLYYVISKIKSKDFRMVTYVIISGFLILLISSPFWASQLNWNIMIFKDAAEMSLNPTKSLGGDIPINLRGYSNLLLDYFLSNQIITLFFIISSVQIFKKIDFNNLFFIATVFTIFLIASKAIAYNRLIYNLDIFLIIIASMSLSIFITKFRNKKTVIITVFILLLVIISNIILMQSKLTPYVPYENEDIKWIHKNVDINKSIIFTPDWFSTVLKSEGYRVAYYEDIPNDPLNTYVVANKESFDIIYNGNFSNIQKYNIDPSTEIYFIWSKWDEKHPFHGLNKSIDPKLYKNNPQMKIIHDEQFTIYRYNYNLHPIPQTFTE